MHRGLAHMIIAGLLLLVACGEEEKNTPHKLWPDAGNPDTLAKPDFNAADLGPLPDGLPYSDKGPVIEILNPKPGQTVFGDVLTVQAKITDPDIVDESKTVVMVRGAEGPTKMSITAAADIYEAKVDIRSYPGSIRLWITATDLAGNANSSTVVDFVRDPGPHIIFLAPLEGAHLKASVTVQVIAVDKVAIKDFSVRIGSHKLTQLTNRSTDPKNQVWAGTVRFDDPMFVPSLAGEQALIAQAENVNGAKTTASRSFIVDNQGPTISITSQSPGELIGGLIALRTNVSDPAGVLASSVRCVIGNDLDTRNIALKQPDGTGNTFEAQFDTRALSQYYVWPVISCRASDLLGNESHYDIEVAIDNGQPIVELDPPADYYMTRAVEQDIGGIKSEVLQCSWPFDPLGETAISDLVQVPQIHYIRARVEDQGNSVPAAPWVPMAGVNPQSAVLYLLDDTSKPLVVDTDGDGYCDDINPDVVPTGAAPDPSEAVAVNLVAVAPSGAADFVKPGVVADGLTYPAKCVSWGDANSSPKPLCLSTDATVAISNAVQKLPSIYVIPPVAGGTEGLQCLGLPFDFGANSFDDGWVCAAAVARDQLGTRGVSMPIRFYLQKNGGYAPSTPAGAGTPPTCLGTRDRDGRVTTTACKFRNPRDTSFAANAQCSLNRCTDCASYNNPAIEFPQAFPHCEVN